MQRKMMIFSSALLIFSLLVAPLGRVGAEDIPEGSSGALPPPPSPNTFTPELEQARARQSMEAVLNKYLAYWGPRYKITLGEVTVEGEWAKGTTVWQSTAKILSGPIHILAHRLANDSWQALMPSTDNAYVQWLEAVPASLLSKSEKSQLSSQATEADALWQPQSTPAVPQAASTIPAGGGPIKPILAQAQPTPTPMPIAGTQKAGIEADATRQPQATPTVPPPPSAVPTVLKKQGEPAGLMPGQEQPTPTAMPIPSTQEAGIYIPSSGVTLIPGTVSVNEAMMEAIVSALENANTILASDVLYFAITDDREVKDWAFVSVVGFNKYDESTGWFLENGAWFGLALLQNDGQGNWYGTIQGTSEFSDMLQDVPNDILDSTAKQNIDPLLTSDVIPLSSNYIFPWQSGTSMFYGALGVHDNGFPSVVSGWKAVDMLSDGNTGAGHAPNRLLASETSTISYVCNDGITVAVRMGNFFYLHLLNNSNLYVGKTFNQSNEMGQLKSGSFDANCGYASQGSNWFHVHWGFPNADFQVEGWTLSVSTQNWTNGSTTVSPNGGWILAGSGGGACPGPSLNSPNDGDVSTSQIINFSWSALSGCTFNGYTIHIKDTSSMDSGGYTIRDTGVGGLSWSENIGTEWNNRDLYWGVRAANAPNGAAWTVRRFRIEPPISCNGQNLPSGYIQCAEEGGFCSFSGLASVVYGANNCFTYPSIFSEGANCNNDVFGDLVPGVHKYCFTNAKQTLTVNKSGSGSGTVTSSPAGINCGSTCSYNFTYNTVVTLAATSTSPSTFGGWSGAGCSGIGTCTVNMNAAQSVTATFNLTQIPSANFDAWPLSGTAPLAVSMHIVDTSYSSNCYWEYGDGQTGNSCASYHNHTYNNPGSYTVKLTVTGTGGSDSKTRTDYIRVGDPAITTPSNPNPGDGTTLERTNDTTLSWSTNGTNCTIHIWGGSIDISPSNTCSSLALHEQRGGDYHWQVTASNGSGSATGPTWGFRIKPYGPTNLTATAISPTQITLNWTVSSDEPSDVDGYDIYYSNGSLIDSVAKGISSYTVNSLTCTNTYSFYIKSRRQGVSSNPSSTVSQQPQACDSEKPVVNWIAPVSNEQTYHVTNQTVQLRVDASDNLSVEHVRFYRWDAINLVYLEIGNVYSFPYQINLDSTVLNYDWNHVFAEAYDGASNVSDREYIFLYRDRPIPDLVPAQWGGWEYPIVPASVPNTNVVNILFAGYTTYIDWGLTNIGSAESGGDAYGEQYIDSTLISRYNFGNVTAGGSWGVLDWQETILTPGWHTLKVIVDPDGLVAESDETNNIWEMQFYWNTAAPFADDMENGLNDWTATGLWHQTQVYSSSPSNSWWYGQESTGNYNTSMVNSGDLTSPAIYIPATGYFLRFWYQYETETQGLDWDKRWVQISVDDGVFNDILQLSDDLMNRWNLSPAIDLSGYAGHAIQVRFHFDTLDNYANDYRGWFIDDFDISTTLPPSCADSYEPNNNTFLATAISYNQTLSADICPGGDLDFYTFDGLAGDKVVVDINAKINGSWLDPYIIMLDSDGANILAENDDEILYMLQDSILGYQLPHDGTYYIKVKAWNHPSVGGPDYFYTIHLLTDSVNPFSAAITSPGNNAWLNPSLETVTATASDDESGINRVEFLWHSADWESSDWIWLGSDEDRLDGWSWDFDTSSLAEQRGGAFYIWAFDWSGNWTGVGAWNLGIDRTPPSVTSSLRAGLNPSTASSVEFTVTFSETISGVDVADFTPFFSGAITSATVSDVSTQDLVSYDVKVNISGGSGTIRLDVVNDGSILDAADRPLSSGYSSGETYTVLPSTFGDVPYGYSVTYGGVVYPLHDHIQALYDAGYTSGCSTSPLSYCPNNTLTRVEAAVFMLRGLEGTSYAPPTDPGGYVFTDDWSSPTVSWGQPWAEGMWDEGLTAGCQTSPRLFCPATTLTRAEASVFGLRIENGAGYTPPATSHIFADDWSDPTISWAEPWAEQAYLHGLLPACGEYDGKPLFCASDLVTRAWAAYLVVEAKDLMVTP